MTPTTPQELISPIVLASRPRRKLALDVSIALRTLLVLGEKSTTSEIFGLAWCAMTRVPTEPTPAYPGKANTKNDTKKTKNVHSPFSAFSVEILPTGGSGGNYRSG